MFPSVSGVFVSVLPFAELVRNDMKCPGDCAASSNTVAKRCELLGILLVLFAPHFCLQRFHFYASSF